METIRHTAIYKEEGVYACFPTLVRGENGQLVTRFATRVQASHIDPRGGYASLVSADEGETWHPTQEAVVDPAWMDQEGRIIIPAAHGWRYAPADQRGALEERGLEVRDVPDGSVAYAEGCIVRTSVDRGRTFTEQEIEIPSQALVMNFYDIASMLRYDEEIIMRAVYGRPVARVPFYEVWLLRSEDNGESWDFLTLASDPGEKVGLGETALLKMPGGDLIALMRSEPVRERKYLYLSRSRDAGKTWSEPVNTGIHGHPPHLLPLRSGEIMCTYGYREDPMGIRAVLSHDEGYTWSASTPKVLRADGCGRGGDLGYPVTVQRADDSLFTIYYFTGADGITYIAGSFWER